MGFLKTNSDGNRVPFQEGGILEYNEVITADKTLTVEDSGKSFILDAIGEDIILPAVQDGLNYRFTCQVVTVTSDWTITAPTAVIQGSVTVDNVMIPAANESLITLVVALFLPGDYIALKCDGTNWYVSGEVLTAAGATLTAP